MTRDLFQIKLAVEAGEYDYLAMDSDALGSLAFDLFRVQLRVQLPVDVRIKNVQSSSRVRRAAGSVSEETSE